MEKKPDIVESLISAAVQREDPPEQAYRRVLAAASAAFREKSARRRRRRYVLAVAAAAVVVLAIALVVQWSEPIGPRATPATADRVIAGVEVGIDETSQFPLSACDFSPNGGNTHLSLEVGRQHYLSNFRCVDAGECDTLEEVWITILPDTKRVRFRHGNQELSVLTRVLEEREFVDGELDEVSLNFVADCNPVNDVYYFGEDVTDGKGNPQDDAWRAGVDGARPGLLMTDRILLPGSRYYQEVAANARDRAEHTRLGVEVTVPAGNFRNCVEVTETTPLKPSEEWIKVHCPGIGMVIDEELELVAIQDLGRGNRKGDKKEDVHLSKRGRSPLAPGPTWLRPLSAKGERPF